MKGYEFKYTPGAVDGFSTEPFQKKGDKDAMAGRAQSGAAWSAIPAFGAMPIAGKGLRKAASMGAKGKKKKKTDGPH